MNTQDQNAVALIRCTKDHLELDFKNHIFIQRIKFEVECFRVTSLADIIYYNTHGIYFT